MWRWFFMWDRDCRVENNHLQCRLNSFEHCQGWEVKIGQLHTPAILQFWPVLAFEMIEQYLRSRCFSGCCKETTISLASLEIGGGGHILIFFMTMTN